MLRELHIAGLGVIEDLDIELHPGLNVLTGETGAGKTLVTVGLSLATGARATASLVRAGAPSARIQARFDAPPGSEDWAEDGEVILARTVGSDGRGTARISGQLATASALAELGASLVEIHGQHQAQRLLDPVMQTAFLDRYAGDAHVVALAAYRETFERYRSVQGEIERLAELARDRERELDLLAYQVREIEDVGPLPGESPALAAEEVRLGHVERLQELTAAASQMLTGEGGALDAAAAASSAIAEAAVLDPGAGELERTADGLSAEMAELARDLRGYRESLTSDPERLQGVRERIAALRGLQRKYGATDEDVREFLGTASARLEALGGADDRLRELTSQVDALRTRTLEQAAVLTRGRLRAAPDLADALQAELRQLGMPGARAEVASTPSPDLGPLGAERVELRFAAGDGQPTLPLAKAASGGELSRTMLACRSVLADLDDVPTLVFDEVDAGIGGEAGLAVGRRLARLAAERQVVVVTHLPQIACFGDGHFRIRKEGGVAAIDRLSEEEQVEELSRMLAGLTGSESAKLHAQELLAQAAEARSGSARPKRPAGSRVRARS